jgi:hypothetical protein
MLIVTELLFLAPEEIGIGRVAFNPVFLPFGWGWGEKLFCCRKIPLLSVELNYIHPRVLSREVMNPAFNPYGKASLPIGVNPLIA